MITVRSDPALDEALSKYVQELQAEGAPASRSSVVRTILYTALNVEDAAVRETVRRVHQVLRTAMTQAVADVRDRLPQYVDEALASEDESRHAGS